MILFPNCKINIGLDILSKREDGYHNIETLMFPVMGLCDSVEILATENKHTRFSSSGLSVDCPPEKNLCLKAFYLMQEKYGLGNVDIHLHKVIPFGAGLGGGSSDASYIIKGVNSVFNLGLSVTQMESIASEIGSDTAFFIRNEPMICSGQGEILTPYNMDILKGKWLVIVKPDIFVSTAEAYSGVKPETPTRLLSEKLTKEIVSWKTEVKNDFEGHIFQKYNDLGLIKDSLYMMGALYASMSGSGSAIYAIFDQELKLSQLNVNTFVYQEVIA